MKITLRNKQRCCHRPLAAHKGFQGLVSQLFLLYKLYEKSFEVNLESHKGFQMGKKKKRKNILEKGNSAYAAMQKNGAGLEQRQQSWEKVVGKHFRRDNAGKKGWGHTESQHEKVMINLAKVNMSPKFLLEHTLLSHFSCVRLFSTPQTAAHQAPLSLEFSRQEHWSGLPFPSPVHESEK